MLQIPSSAYRQEMLPFVTMCGRYSSVCPLTTSSSYLGIIWCPRCDNIAPTAPPRSVMNSRRFIQSPRWLWAVTSTAPHRADMRCLCLSIRPSCNCGSRLSIRHSSHPERQRSIFQQGLLTSSRALTGQMRAQIQP